MTRTLAGSADAAGALAMVEALQRRFVDTLERAAEDLSTPLSLTPVEWLRDGGRHGGGVRYVVGDTAVFDRASVNVSQVHYDDLPDKRLGSATALSCIIHPANPHAPSMHMHISWTQMRDGSGYWRIMADLNPSNPEPAATHAFAAMLEAAAPQHHVEAFAQGDRYFHIPALERHRGVCHFYMEGHRSDDPQADAKLARTVGEATIDRYGALLIDAVRRHPHPDAEACDAQLAYHTVYLFQVLTLDRGTTSGLLVHDQNDVGILGSLPSHVDRERLAAWGARLGPPQQALVEGILGALPPGSPCAVTVEAKRALAQVVRAHYRAHPEALALQASGAVVPPTVANHR